MSEGFSNAVVGGSGILKRIAIRSFNYVLGSTGWTVNADGSAEFNNLTVRGSFFGLGIILNANGMFIYSGTPGPTTLFVSICGSATTDPFSTTCQAGIFLYGPNSSSISLINLSGQPTLDLTPASQTHMTTTPSLAALALNAGTASEFLLTTLQSGQDNGLDNSAVQLFSESNDGTTTAATVALVAAGLRVVNVFKTGVQFTQIINAITGTAANPSLVTTDTFHSITLDANWSTLAGQPVPSVQLTADGMVQINGAIQFNVNIASTNVNGGNPLASVYRPATEIFIAGAPGSAGIAIQTNGVIVAAQAPGQATVFCNFCGRYPRNL